MITQKKVAFFLSRILGPLPLICVLWLVTAVKSGIGFWKAIWVYPVIFLASIAIPTALSLYLIATKHVTSIEWPKVSERRRFLIPVMLTGITPLVFLAWALTNSTIFHLSLVTAVIVAATIVIFTVFNYKISLHMVIASGVFAGINLFFHQQYLWLYLLLIPIAWARYVLKMHSFWQLLAGFVLVNSLILLSVLLFGYPAVP
ncbi:hypothetical protein HY440_01900 [Candidatus Microgenomates bacterium]|nr:hypothetical protein [Candidatus Microgenomates bacterium]